MTITNKRENHMLQMKKCNNFIQIKNQKSEELEVKDSIDATEIKIINFNLPMSYFFLGQPNYKRDQSTSSDSIQFQVLFKLSSNFWATYF